MNVTTNHQWRDFLYRHDVPESVLSDDFDWLPDDEDFGFIRYRNAWYHLSMFLRTTIKGWHGSHGTSAFSVVLIEVSSDGEKYRIGTMISS